MTAPAQASRGDDLTVSAVIGDAGGSGASGIGATLTFDPPDGLRFRGSSQTQTINVPPGGLTTVSWTVEARQQATATLVVTVDDGTASFQGSAVIQIAK